VAVTDLDDTGGRDVVAEINDAGGEAIFTLARARSRCFMISGSADTALKDQGRSEGPLACLMTKHFDPKFAASMKLVKGAGLALACRPAGNIAHRSTAGSDQSPARISRAISRGTESSNQSPSSSQSVSAVKAKAASGKPRS
jgi:hypothetical protein